MAVDEVLDKDISRENNRSFTGESEPVSRLVITQVQPRAEAVNAPGVAMHLRENGGQPRVGGSTGRKRTPSPRSSKTPSVTALLVDRAQTGDAPGNRSRPVRGDLPLARRDRPADACRRLGVTLTHPALCSTSTWPGKLLVDSEPPVLPVLVAAPGRVEPDERPWRPVDSGGPRDTR